MAKSSIYLEAINILERDGWCQGVYSNDSGKYCMIGALGKANGTPYPMEDSYSRRASLLRFRELENSIDKLANKMGYPLPVSYNDSHTKEEVIQLLKEMHDYECAPAIVTEG